MKKERRKEEESIVPKVDREICRRNFDGLRCIHDEILLFERSRTERQSLSPSVFSFLSFFLNARDFWGLSPPVPRHRFLDLSPSLHQTAQGYPVLERRLQRGRLHAERAVLVHRRDSLLLHAAFALRSES